MKISDMIAKLQQAEQEFGDIELTTWDGVISHVTFQPAVDGVIGEASVAPNELGMEIIT